MKRRALSIFLAVILTLTLIPTSAFAATSDYTMEIELSKLDSITYNVKSVMQVKQMLTTANSAKISGKYIITSLFSKSFLDREGHLVKSVPPLDLQDPQKDEKVFRAHMLVYVTDRRNLDESIFLRLAYDKLRNQGYVSMDDLDFLVDRNAVIPDDRKEIIKRGLQLGVNGELYAAIHILLPQMENLIRELVKMCGDTVTFLREDGTEEFKPLSELLESRNLKESYDENFLFTLSTLLNERGGPNLRNENAHGFLSPIEGSSGAALCFLSLMIRFLSYYSRESIDILEKLLETE